MVSYVKSSKDLGLSTRGRQWKRSKGLSGSKDSQEPFHNWNPLHKMVKGEKKSIFTEKWNSQRQIFLDEGV